MTRKRIFTLIILLVLAVIAVRFLPGCGEGLDMLINDSAGSYVENWEDWTYRRSIIITNSGTAVTDYQVNITVNTDNDFYVKAAVNGNDIRFNYSGTSLSYWIENWNPGGDSSIWVKVPSLPAGDTVIYLYYGNADQPAASDFDSTFTKNSGLSGLAAQWHMDEGSGSSTLGDSSGNSNTGTIAGASWTGTDGGGWYDRSDVKFSAGDSPGFDGLNDYAAVTDHNSLDAIYITIAAWVKTSSDVVTTQFIIAKWDETLVNQRSYALSISNGSFYFWTSPDGDSISQHSLIRGSALSDTSYHVTAVSDGSNKRIHVNGSELLPAGSWNNTIHQGDSNLTMGRRIHATTQNFFSGIIDEVSIYNRALSAEEVLALSQRRKYSSYVNSPLLGLEETVP